MLGYPGENTSSKAITKLVEAGVDVTFKNRAKGETYEVPANETSKVRGAFKFRGSGSNI